MALIEVAREANKKQIVLWKGLWGEPWRKSPRVGLGCRAGGCHFSSCCPAHPRGDLDIDEFLLGSTHA